MNIFKKLMLTVFIVVSMIRCDFDFNSLTDEQKELLMPFLVETTLFVPVNVDGQNGIALNPGLHSFLYVKESDGVKELYIGNLENGKKLKINVPDGYEMGWSSAFNRDCTVLYFDGYRLSDHYDGLFKADLLAGTVTKIAGDIQHTRANIRPSPDGTKAMYIVEGLHLYMLDMVTGTETLVHTFGNVELAPGTEVVWSDDGSKIYLPKKEPLDNIYRFRSFDYVSKTWIGERYTDSSFRTERYVVKSKSGYTYILGDAISNQAFIYRSLNGTDYEEYDMLRYSNYLTEDANGVVYYYTAKGTDENNRGYTVRVEEDGSKTELQFFDHVPHVHAIQAFCKAKPILF